MKPFRKLPPHPDFDQLKRQAKELLEAFLAGEPDAVAEVNAHHRNFDASKFALHDAQLVLARAYGYDSWPKLKAYVDGATVERLCGAVKAGDIAQVRAMLKLRPELVKMIASENTGHTALHSAVLSRQPEMVRLLMQHGADARAGIYPHSEATNPLAIATDRGYDKIATIIREEELRRTGRPSASQMPAELVDALYEGQEATAVAILEHRLDLVHAQKLADGWTLLHAASALLLEQLSVWLIDHGAEVNRQAKEGFTPLEVLGKRCSAAARSARLNATADLLRARGAAMTPRAAGILGDAEFLRKRHAEERLTNPQDLQGWLLQLAVEYDRPELLTQLLDLGLDPDARARVPAVEDLVFTWGMPLWHCARFGKHAMAEILLERGADPNGQVYASGTPLSEAYGQRDEKMIALLERFGGKSNAAMAGLYRRPELARKLLADEKGTALADSFWGGTFAEQLLGGAACGGEPEILRMALERIDWPPADPRWYPVLTQPLRFWNHWVGPWCHHEWDRATYLTCFRLLLERCGSPNGRLPFGRTLLHEVVASRPHLTPDERVAFATVLLDAGARTNVRDDVLKSTPLGWACRWGRVEMVKLLLARGADPVEADAEPWAAPHAWAEKKTHPEIAALLHTAR